MERSRFAGYRRIAARGRHITLTAALAAFDEWRRRFAQHVESKGTVDGADDVARSAKSTTQ